MAGRARPRKRGWFTSFSGILASISTIIAAAATVFATIQTGKVNQLTITVRQQRQQLQQAAPAGSSGSGGSGSAGGVTLTGGTYLSAVRPTVDHAELETGAQNLLARPYPNSITFRCDGAVNTDEPDEAFNVGGHALFRAEVGVPDNAQNATSLNETVIFANQGGSQLIRPVVVSLGKPAFVRLNISRVTQLEITCSGADPRTQQPDNGNELTLGNAYVSG
jgi:hypothetical protein